MPPHGRRRRAQHRRVVLARVRRRLQPRGVDQQQLQPGSGAAHELERFRAAPPGRGKGRRARGRAVEQRVDELGLADARHPQ